MPATESETASPRHPRKMPRGVLASVMLFTGAAGLIYEYVLSTVMTYLLGNSIEQFSVTVGLMFFMMGVGGFVQKLFRSSLVETFIAIELLLVIAGGFSPLVMQWLFAYAPDSFSGLRLIYIAVIGLMIGVEIPLVMRINEQFSSSLDNNIASTWAWDYVGGALGVVAWIWMLRQFIPLTHISFFVAACNLIVAIIALAYFWRHGLLGRKSNGPVGVAICSIIVAVILAGYVQSGDWSKMINQRLYDSPIVFEVTSKYQVITITQAPDVDAPDGQNTELFLNGNKQFSSKDEAIYHELLVHPAMNVALQRKNVLVLGGGDGMAVREILKYKDVESVTLVDLDPEIVKLARDNQLLSDLNRDSFKDARVQVLATNGVNDTGAKRDILAEDEENSTIDCEEITEDDGDRRSECIRTSASKKIGEVNIYTIDADQFLSSVKGAWDIVVVDLPDPNSIELAKLYSVEFYEKIRSVMSPNGALVVQSTSPYHAKETYLCILRTIAAGGFGVVPYHENVPSFGDWGWVLASPSLNDQVLHDRAGQLSSFGVQTSVVDANVLRRAMIFNKGALTGVSKEISTLMRPTVFDYYVYEAWKTE